MLITWKQTNYWYISGNSRCSQRKEYAAEVNVGRRKETSIVSAHSEVNVGRGKETSIVSAHSEVNVGRGKETIIVSAHSEVNVGRGKETSFVSAHSEVTREACDYVIENVM